MNQGTDVAHPGLRVLVLAGSLRADSFNKKLASLAAKVATDYGASVDHASMSEFEVPPYDGDCETANGAPPGAVEFEKRLRECDAFIISSPEYNASMPGILKNLIDWTSRFRPQPFDGKHGLLISASPSMVGGNRGLWALRVPFEHLGARIFPDMFSLATAHKALDGGDFVDPALKARFETMLNAFLALTEAAKHYPCLKRAWTEFPGEPPELHREEGAATA